MGPHGGTVVGTHELTGINGAYTGPGGMNADNLAVVTLLGVAPTDPSHHFSV